MVPTTAEGGGSRRPNIVLIMSDEHDPAVTGCYGDRVVRTPHLDRLAASGTTFDAAYCNSPLCVPSRLSFTAGQHIHRFNGWSNACWITTERPDLPTLPRVLHDAGYGAYLCGKMHYDPTRDYGFQMLPCGPVDLNNTWKNGRLGRVDPDHRDPQLGAKNWQQRADEIGPNTSSWVYDHDRGVTDGAISFLQQRHRDDQPFFLLAGHIAPHFPLWAPPELCEYYRDKVPAPLIPPGHIDSLPRNYHNLRSGFGVPSTQDPIVQHARECYWALTEWYDSEVGRLLAAIEASPERDNTVVIYTSDHGENKGDHGMWWKNCAFEASARVPLIVSWPGVVPAGERREQACSLVDVVQTCVDLAGATAPESWDGDSLLPLLQTKADQDEWKDQAVCLYFGQFISSGLIMIRRGSVEVCLPYALR